MKSSIGIAIGMTLTAVVGITQAGSITLDGITTGGDVYTNSETVTWFNGHKTAQSIYGSFGSQFDTTTIKYGTAGLAGDNSGTQYFFLNIEVPIHAKNMIWQNLDWTNTDYPIGNTNPLVGLTESDVSTYRPFHETHHNMGDMKLDFSGATGSEKAIFVDSTGAAVFEADLAGAADSSFGLVDFKDSVDFLLDSGAATLDLSLARDTTMSFEFMFELNSAVNNELLSYVRNGIEFHLSPERDMASPAAVPMPTAVAMGCFGLLGVASRRRRTTI